ncbi:MAG: FecR domain-containing protein [Sphingobium sp.]
MAERDENILEIAADWADRLAELTPEEEGELAAWLKASPNHAHAFATMHRLTRDRALFDALGAEPPVLSAKPSPMTTPRPGSAARRPWARETAIGAPVSRRQAIAAASVAALGLPLAFFALKRNANGDTPPRNFASAVAQQKRYALSDGSRLTLDAASSVSTLFTPDLRLLDLQKGGARFDVAHDPNRPFEVRTPVARMTALGTSFTVDRLSGATELRVFEGQVRLDMPGRGWLVMMAGQWALVSGTNVERGSFIPGDYDDWQTHWLDAESMRLAFAIERLSRYSRTPIRLADPRLAKRSFSGRFRLDQPERSLSLICGLFDLMPVERNGTVYLERSKSGA